MLLNSILCASVKQKSVFSMLIIFSQVEVSVESIDKAGNFIGWLWIENVNLSVALVQDGYAHVHSSAERSEHYRALCNAEESAKTRREKVLYIVSKKLFVCVLCTENLNCEILECEKAAFVLQ